jgi:ATP-dependent RNA helicase SUPV3L1/SUV3
VIGRLDGFTFAPDAAEAGSDAKALQATAQKALAGEIDARAEKLSAAPDEQFVLASDATIRWTGDAVAKLVAADDALHPRVRIISDDRLSGAPREAVQARLDLWLKTHIGKLLGPLFDLAKAEDITGIARGIAFQLIEALGVLERQKIAAEMKDLDQPSRATLRKYGVRFGAYHIYVPALLKPAARALASLLWAEKHSNVDMSALSGAQHLAGSGRTSFPVDKQLDRDAYRVLGYRQCGERAVRVDILERLADLIRPALAWRETSLGEKPSGAFDGRGFVVTQAMTSLTGSAGEDFASVLRALGYRMERRPPLPPKPPAVETAAAEAAPADAASSATPSPELQLAPPEAAAAGEAVAPEPAAAVEAADIVDGTSEAVDGASEAPQASEEVVVVRSATLLPEVTFTEVSLAEVPRRDEAAAIEPPPVEIAAVEAAPAEAAAIGSEPEPAAAAIDAAATEAPQQNIPVETPPEAAAADGGAVAATPDAAAAPEMVEVWRPGGRSEERRPRHDRNRHPRRDRPQDRPQDGAQPATAVASEAGEAAKGDKGERHRRGRRDRNQEFRKPRTDAPAEAATATAPAAEGGAVREARENKGRPARERFEGKGREQNRDQGRDRDRDRDKGKFGGGRDKGGRDKGGRDKRDSGPSHRQFATSAAPRERDRPVDPNSPFAKLAALKEQLTANRKD